MQNSLWFLGPPFLQQPYRTWPSFPIELPTELPELKKEVVVFFRYAKGTFQNPCVQNYYRIALSSRQLFLMRFPENDSFFSNILKLIFCQLKLIYNTLYSIQIGW